MITRFIAILLGCLASFTCHAQLDFRLQTLDSENGLRHDQLNVFFGTDDAGFHWIGSNGGAYRYTGQELKLFNTAENEDKQITVYSNFFQDTLGNTWFSTAEDLFQYDAKTESLKRHPIATSSVSRMGWHLFNYDATTHELWLSNTNELRIVNATTLESVHPPVSSKSVRYLPLRTGSPSKTTLGFPWLLRKGIERLIVDENGLVRVEPSSDKFLNQLVINGGTVDNSGRVWLSSTLGLVLYDPVKDEVIEIYRIHNPTDLRIWAVATLGDLLLVATHGDGIWVFDPTTAKYLNKLDAKSSSGESITDQPRSIHIAPNNVILASRGEGGVDVLIPTQNAVTNVVDKKGDPIIARNVTTTPYGSTFASTSQNIVFELDKEGNIISESAFKKGTLLAGSKHLISSTKNNVWYAQGDRIHLKVNSTKEWELFHRFDSEILNIFNHGDSILVHTKRGIRFIDDKEIVTKSDISFSEANQRFIFKIGPRNYMHWKGGKWMYILGISENDLIITDSLLSTGELFYSTFLNGTDTLAISTIGKTTTFTKGPPNFNEWMLIDTILTRSRLIDFKIDSKQNKWLLTDEGLQYEINNTERRSVNKEHGLPSNTGLPNTLELIGDSVVFAGTRSGLVIYNLLDENTLASNIKSKVYIRNTWIDERPFEISSLNEYDPITLTHDHHVLQFEIGTIGIYDEDNVEINYRVLGLDNTWQTANRQGILNLERIPPGKHVLEMYAIESSGEQSDIYRVNILSELAFWETRWFRFIIPLLIALVVALIAFILHRTKITKERKHYQQQLVLANERDRIARELHDELGGDLASILFLSESDGQPITTSAQSQVNQLSKNALRHMREIIWTLQEDKAFMVHLWEKLSTTAREQCAMKAVNLELVIEPSLLKDVRGLSSILRRNIYLLVKESVSNAIKHAQADKLSIVIKNHNNTSICISIIDDGIGFDASTSHVGMGLVNLNRRAAEVGGVLRIESSEESGTAVQMCIPIGK
ncbi:MAG: ATP-binding protein [Saprospiraceae bacterium]